MAHTERTLYVTTDYGTPDWIHTRLTCLSDLCHARLTCWSDVWHTLERHPTARTRKTDYGAPDWIHTQTVLSEDRLWHTRLTCSSDLWHARLTCWSDLWHASQRHVGTHKKDTLWHYKDILVHVTYVDSLVWFTAKTRVSLHKSLGQVSLMCHNVYFTVQTQYIHCQDMSEST